MMKLKNEQNRRDFLKVSAAVGASMITSTALGNLNPIAGMGSGRINNYTGTGKTRTLGKGNYALEVSPIGLGCMSMTRFNPRLK